jgi:hypothetical protein
MQSTNKKPIQHRKYRNLSINHANGLDFFSQLCSLLSVSTHRCLELAQCSHISGTGLTAEVVANTDLCLQSLDLCTKVDALVVARVHCCLELHSQINQDQNINRKQQPSHKPVCCYDGVPDYLAPAVKTNTNTQISYHPVSGSEAVRKETKHRLRITVPR